MALVGKAMAALLRGAMIMVGVGVGALVGGNPANLSTTILVMITLVLWSVLFLALVFMDVMREVMLQRVAQGAVRKALQKTLDRRLVVVSAALSLIAGSLTMRYVDGDLDWGRRCSSSHLTPGSHSQPSSSWSSC